MSTDVDLMVGSCRVVRRPAEGRIEIFRSIHGVEIGLFVPPEHWSGGPYWRIIEPKDPVPDVCVDLTDHLAGHTVSIGPRINPPAPEIGKPKPWRSSALSRADIELDRRGFVRDFAGEPQGFCSYVIHWADGTTLEGDYSSAWKWCCVEGKTFRMNSSSFRDAIRERLREEAGLAPTPERFLRDGLETPAKARQDYLREVDSHPQARSSALHILRSCAI